jgi:hypothetical protein
MLDLVKTLLGIVTGGATTTGGLVANVAAFGALAAAVTPLALGFFKHREEVLVTVTVGEAGFWGLIIGVFMFLVVKLAYRAPHP